MTAGYEEAIEDALESRSPCPAIVLTPTGPPMAEVELARDRVLFFAGLANLVPLLALGRRSISWRGSCNRRGGT